MVSNLIKITICVTSFVVISAVKQQPLWAFDNNVLSRGYSNNSATPEISSDLAQESDSSDLSSQPPVGGMSAAPLESYMTPYSNTFVVLSSNRKRKIPEPSALTGLTAIALWWSMQQRKIKKS
ncbi:hypothetical protein [Nostoc sp. FACHB-110]|uniref:hypothetical protein n=1 Tax=Nostoc sp. FACHB-110 TaxID=2692834 RepID=UPI0016860FFA|nr:hypothetical protein [Nostoc sp. FACHB-110]MBD2437841.1 hypothetical protein [Nostoc sp. FACHB-110]